MLDSILIPINVHVDSLDELKEKIVQLTEAVEKASSLADEVAVLGKGLTLKVDV